MSIHVGDLIFFDWNESDSDGITHVVIVVGFTVSGVPCYAGHTENRWMEPLHVNTVLTGSTSMYEYLSYESWDMYVVHMTDTDGFKEVTKNYIGKTVTIKSLETGKYLSSNTDDSTANTDVIANRDAADSWEQFDVIAGDYGAVGFKAHGNSNFLSTRRDVGKEYAPIRACAQTYQQWEAFRIFEKDGVQYRRDIKDALQCYLDAKESFVDTDIEGFWELELMIHTNSFNDPERFEIERKSFMERGLITEEQYHRTAFIAYMVNLQKEKAREHEELVAKYEHYTNPMNGSLVLQQEEIHFLNWIGAIKPSFQPPQNSMVERRANEVLEKYQTETWHKQLDRTRKNQFDVNRTIAIDAWGLYILSEEMRLDTLNKFEKVFIPHSTIIRLLEELSRTNNQKIRDIMNFLESSHNIYLESAGFKTQIEVRNLVSYTEIAAVIAIAKEKDSMVIMGEPDLGLKFIDRFGRDIIRINEIESRLFDSSKMMQ